MSFSERDEIRAAVHETHPGHLVDVDGRRMILRDGAQQRELPVAEGAWFVNCTSHLRHIPHEPILQDSGLTCAPQFAMGFTGTSAYFITHLWMRDALASIAPALFRGRFDVEPKLRLLCHLSLMVIANMAMAGARLPLAIPARFQGDFNKWYPLPRQLALTARFMAKRGEVIRKAERLLKLRFSDAPDPA
jgi:hypothetical protein